MSKTTLTSAELEAHLAEQLGALQRSAELFDEGYFAEARRLAVTLRVLLHTGRDDSLLKRLGRHEIDFVDTAKPFDPLNLVATHTLVSLVFHDGLVSYGAALDRDEPTRLTPFTEWWDAIVFADGQGRTLKRADVVLIASNQDGGAHVDGAVRTDYAELRSKNSLGWTANGLGAPEGDAGFCAIRQIAHEVLKTLIPRYAKTSEEVLTARKSSEISGGKLRFYPHEKQFFSNSLTSKLTPGETYWAEVAIDRITTGSVRMIVNSAATDPITSAGIARIAVVAGEEENTGVYGEYTDAVIDSVSLTAAQ